MTRSSEEYKKNMGITWLGFFVNLLLTCVKIFAGVFGKSQAITADGLHSFSDLFTDCLSLLGLRCAHIPKDKTHPYGHGKIENVMSGLLSLVLILLGIGISYKGITTILSPEERNVPTLFPLIIAFISILIKELLYYRTWKQGEKTHSQLLIANAWHHRSDSISSIATLGGIAGAKLGYPILDPIAAGIVGVFIIFVGVKIGKNAFDVLIDTSLPETILERMDTLIRGVKGVQGVHDLKTRYIGSQVAVEVHVEVDPDISVAKGHDITLDVESVLKNQVPSIGEVVVHLDVSDDSK